MKIVELQKENKEEVERVVANSYSGLQIAIRLIGGKNERD